ncbi:hypothetical protein CDD82_3944 [Ophiocordyceps australis]|uniref:Transcriptional regulatory protein RXT2 N-terminal domain-containing protein n=1 Tax=Ophiocordyceps australis TaxID=1399860 RepID=A0A2C5XM21_9HYPO|nr:hypothetical protein CDD82_3944 [Ophiocordyceps australis]
MASHQILFAETIAGMKKAFKRKAYDSDSDSAIENCGNRGYKLKKRALFARQGQLAPTQGPSSYRESVDYAGTQRAIIHRNSPILDEDGYELDSEDDDERKEEAELAAAELNPYNSIRIEHILAPLTAATDLQAHTSLSKAFTSKTLTNLVSHSCNMLRRENNTLWRIRHLLTMLCGDSTWIPCGRMVGPHDADLYREDHVAMHLLSLAQGSAAESSPPAIWSRETRDESAKQASDTSTTAQVDDAEKRRQEKRDDGQGPAGHGDGSAEETHRIDAERAVATRSPGNNGVPCDPEDNLDNTGPVQSTTGGNEGSRGNDGARNQGVDTQASGPESNPKIEVEAAAKLQGGTSEGAAPSTSPSAEQTVFIHPLFHMPPGVQSDRDAGLPPNEAAEVRRLFLLYVQKQEEVSRGTDRLHQGLLKAERLKREVLHWSKAESHCGINRDMSDGEDWYDKEEWGLEEDLKKGQDEEEEDTTTTGKKTRTRR